MSVSLSVAAVTVIDDDRLYSSIEFECMEKTKMRFEGTLKKWSEVQVTSAFSLFMACFLTRRDEAHQPQTMPDQRKRR